MKMDFKPIPWSQLQPILEGMSWPQLAEVFDQETFNASKRGLLLHQFLPEFSAYCKVRIPELARRSFHE